MVIFLGNFDSNLSSNLDGAVFISHSSIIVKGMNPTIQTYQKAYEDL